jgi:hypothetical protein
VAKREQRTDGGPGTLIQSVERFTALLPELSTTAEARALVAAEAPRFNRLFRLVLEEARGERGFKEQLPLLQRAGVRLNALVDTLETDSVLRITAFAPVDDLAVFHRLREKPQEEVLRLLDLLLEGPGALAARDRVVLHFALAELGVPLGLEIGIVGWIKLVLVCLLVILLIISLFKPELLPAVTALAQILAAIDAAGGGGGGAAPHAGPPAPPGSTTITRPDGTVIVVPPGHTVYIDPNGGITITPPPPPPPPPPQVEPSSLHLITHCDWVRIPTEEGELYDVEIEGYASPPQPVVEIKNERNGNVVDTVRPGEKKTVAAMPGIWVHLVSAPGRAVTIRVRKTV